jgi:protein gp37
VSDNSAIEWTDATWNPVTGCTKVSPGCDNCYAETFSERWRSVPGHYFEQGFDVQLRPNKLAEPLKWRKPRRVFVNSMSDLFHDDVPDEYIARVFAVMAATPRHTYQLLTKRHGRMRSLLSSEAFPGMCRAAQADLLATNAGEKTSVWPLPNVWVGVSVENQQWADIRIPVLLRTPAAVRFLSCEPLLGPVDLRRGQYAMPPTGEVLGTTLDGIDWVIVGGESGMASRPMQVAWARSLRDQCAAADVAFFFKQWGGRTPKANGRELDGRTWDEMPETEAAA